MTTGCSLDCNTCPIGQKKILCKLLTSSVHTACGRGCILSHNAQKHQCAANNSCWQRHLHCFMSAYWLHLHCFMSAYWLLTPVPQLLQQSQTAMCTSQHTKQQIAYKVSGLNLRWMLHMPCCASISDSTGTPLTAPVLL